MSSDASMTRIIGPSPSGTPVETGGPRSSPRALPDDLLREASRRLGIMSLMGGILWVTAWILIQLAAVTVEHPLPGGLQVPDYIVILSALFSISLFVYTRKSTRSHAFMLDLGLWYLVLTALAIGFMWHGDPDRDAFTTIMPMFTWIGPLVLMFAAIIPTPPKKMLGAALIAVSMAPLGMLLARWKGMLNFEGLGPVVLMHYPDYMLALITPVISLVVTRLGQKISKAREMGSYHVGALIGRGGMGEVYHATHRMLARPAAIKLISPEMIAHGDSVAAQLAVKRFRREAEVAANLRSPHTVALYDFGITEDGALYFVMELLEGMDLEELVRTHGPLPPARVIYILSQICESLEEAHSLGLVHRDIKPANIHVGRLGLRHDFVKVLDFGLVKSVDTKERSPDHAAETAEGVTPGTPDYMAPEMTLGSVLDGRADLYAVGCVGYFMLTGRPVFEAANVFHVIARHLNDEPVPPSQVTKQPVPKLLEDLMLSCLRKRPDERPQSAADLARRLASVPVEPWGEDQAEAWWRARTATE